MLLPLAKWNKPVVKCHVETFWTCKSCSRCTLVEALSRIKSKSEQLRSSSLEATACNQGKSVFASCGRPKGMAGYMHERTGIFSTDVANKNSSQLPWLVR